jgi:hypothetical protein
MLFPSPVALLLALSTLAFAQPAPVIPPGLANITLPTYVAGGGAFNQLAGVNLWASAIVPISANLGMYESTTADLFPVKVTVAGKSAYVFQSSFREGVHKLLHQDANNAILIGADAGYSFAQASAAGASTSGVSAAVTFTYVRQINAHWAVMVPVRSVYVPVFGGWNAILEVGAVWKP